MQTCNDIKKTAAEMRAAIQATDETAVIGYTVGGFDSASRRATAYRLAANVEELASHHKAWTVCVTAREGYVWIESTDADKADAWMRGNIMDKAVKETSNRVQVSL